MNKIYLYLFILAVLMNGFTFAYFSKKNRINQQTFDQNYDILNDSLLLIQGELLDLKKFTLDGNYEAQYYFDQLNSNDLEGLISLKKNVETILMSFNENKEGNLYTGYSVLEGEKFEMENILFLNHQWILGNFSNGIYKGQVLLKYFIDTNDEVSFEIGQTYLYSTKL
jgi:hypothetical protein